MREREDPTRLARRAAVLESFGAPPDVIQELLSYNQTAFVAPPQGLPSAFPLADAPQVAAWLEYRESALRLGVFETLRDRLVQLRFPIRKGISQSEEYLGATRRGQVLRPETEGLRLEAPSQLTLDLHPTAVGRVPVLTAGSRADFVSLLQALAHRNEPVPVADSQGAALISGLNNWDRVWRYRREWERHRPGRPSPSEWSAEMARMAKRRELYQDRIVLLSRGPYSDVPAARLGMQAQEWLEASWVLRREHECAHLFTKELFESARNNLMDELLADYAGIVAAAGHYRADWFLLFLGIEGSASAGPKSATTGRLRNYLGDPPLSAAAVAVLCRLVERAAFRLEAFDARRGDGDRDLQGMARMLLALSDFTLEELAAEDAEQRLAEAVVRDRS